MLGESRRPRIVVQIDSNVDGTSVGVEVGTSVGADVGDLVGPSEGAADGASVGKLHRLQVFGQAEAMSVSLQNGSKPGHMSNSAHCPVGVTVGRAEGRAVGIVDGEPVTSPSPEESSPIISWPGTSQIHETRR